MLVKGFQSFAAKVPYKKKIRDGLFKSHYEDAIEYHCDMVFFVCDESEIDQCVDRDIQYELRNRYPVNSGYTFDIPAGIYDGDYANGYSFKRGYEYIKDCKLDELTKYLTLEQFAKAIKECWENEKQ